MFRGISWGTMRASQSDAMLGARADAASAAQLLQAGVMRTSKRSSSNPSSSSAQWVATIQAAGGLVRTNIPMKNTILRIALTNKKQVLIPDVQKLINQLGNVNTDLFASRLLRPPSSVLLLPLRASGVGECQCDMVGQSVVMWRHHPTKYTEACLLVCCVSCKLSLPQQCS